MNRRTRRRLSRASRRWLAAAAADPTLTCEELLYLASIAEAATDDGRVWIDDDGIPVPRGSALFRTLEEGR